MTSWVVFFVCLRPFWKFRFPDWFSCGFVECYTCDPKNDDYFQWSFYHGNVKSNFHKLLHTKLIVIFHREFQTRLWRTKIIRISSVRQQRATCILVMHDNQRLWRAKKTGLFVSDKTIHAFQWEVYQATSIIWDSFVVTKKKHISKAKSTSLIIRYFYILSKMSLKRTSACSVCIN